MATIKSIEEKAKRYDKALEAVKSLQEVNPSDEGIQNWVNENFPELEESEDERILKNLKAVVKEYDMWAERGLGMNDILAWLEKKAEQKPTDKVEPKFNVGDVMRTLQEATNNITSGLPVVVSIDNEYYHCTNELIAIKDQNNYEYPPINRIQKPAWSEEDELVVAKILCICNDFERSFECSPSSTKVIKEDVDKIDNWLKSIKDKYT